MGRKKKGRVFFLPSTSRARTFLAFCPPTGDESDIISRQSFENVARFIHWKLSLLVPSKGRSTKSADMAKLEPMMRLVLHCIDRVRRFRLGKEVC